MGAVCMVEAQTRADHQPWSWLTGGIRARSGSGKTSANSYWLPLTNGKWNHGTNRMKMVAMNQTMQVAFPSIHVLWLDRKINVYVYSR